MVLSHLFLDLSVLLSIGCGSCRILRSSYASTWLAVEFGFESAGTIDRRQFVLGSPIDWLDFDRLPNCVRFYDTKSHRFDHERCHRRFEGTEYSWVIFSTNRFSPIMKWIPSIFRQKMVVRTFDWTSLHYFVDITPVPFGHRCVHSTHGPKWWLIESRCHYWSNIVFLHSVHD